MVGGEQESPLRVTETDQRDSPQRRTVERHRLRASQLLKGAHALLVLTGWTSTQIVNVDRRPDIGLDDLNDRTIFPREVGAQHLVAAADLRDSAAERSDLEVPG